MANGGVPDLPSPTITDRIVEPPQRLHNAPCPPPHIPTMEKYRTLYKESITEPETFWAKMAKELLHWSKPFNQVKGGSFEKGDMTWFKDGQLNASYNCVDRHAAKNPDKVAIIWEEDEPEHSKHITYKQLLKETCRLANALKRFGVKKGDVVAIYMPMVPETIYAMMACVRIGAIHSVIFAGFSAEAVRDRINDAQCKVLITADEGKRGGKTIQIKKIVDEALASCPSIQHVMVFKRTGSDVAIKNNRDIWWDTALEAESSDCPPEAMDAEDPLFMLYTSGSTGKPKGVVHTHGGYLLGAASTVKYVFDYHDGDVHGCMADVGWITGHSYIVYGPLLLGGTTVLFESIPTYPTAARYWELIQKHKITQFYTAPTAIRALKRLGDEWLNETDRSSVRVLGSVGEPINSEAWIWYHEVVGQKQCAVIDTYWQTETGSIIVSPFPCCTPAKPGSATFPFFGIDLVVLDPVTGTELEGNDVTGVLAIRDSWPSIARTVYGDHGRFMSTYLNPYRGFYFTGDGVTRDKDGYYWIRGRVDDVINVSGHRLSTAEIESALVLHESCAEAAVVGVNDDITGQAIVAFCLLKPTFTTTPELEKALVMSVRSHIGPFATPKRIHCVHDLPKTRSGKIMRRVLRKIANEEVSMSDLSIPNCGGKLGDLSTLADPSIVESLIRKVLDNDK